MIASPRAAAALAARRRAHSVTARPSLRRVAVTGIGIVSPLGVTAPDTWRALLAGRCGVKRLGERFADLPCTVAATVDRDVDNGGFDANRFVKNTRTQGVPFIELALGAAEEALSDADWRPGSEGERDRTGVAVGSGIGSVEDIVDGGRLAEASVRRLSPFFVPRILINMAAGHISMVHGLRGPNHAVSTACTTGAHAVGDAFRMIQVGDADVMLAGGTEASVNRLTIAGFARAKALATKFNDDPASSSRPFDADRCGFVMGEGAAVLVLEEMEHARARGARVYAEVAGYGMSADAHHITAPAEDGGGAVRSMRAALTRAAIDPSLIGYINAHATSTPTGDAIEARAIARVLGGRGGASVSSTKGATGHLLGAAGAIEAAFAVLSVHHDVVPPTLNLHTPPEDCPLDLVAHTARERPVQAALSNSFGFGGTNASLVFTKPDL